MAAPPPPLPVIDISTLLPGAPPSAAADAAAAEVRAACLKPGLGFFYAVGHGVPDGVTAAAFDALEAVFGLGAGEKAALDAKQSPLRRGYVGPGALEHTCARRGGAGGDAKESFTVGAEPGADARARSPLHGPNQWPPTLPAFEPAVRAYVAAGLDAARGVARGLAAALGQGEGAFVDALAHPVAQCVLLRYPPVDAGGDAATPTIGCGAHTDCGLLTLISQRGPPGLQVRSPAGAWLDVPPLPGTLVVNLGDLAEFWSGGRVASMEHRVLPPRAGRGCGDAAPTTATPPRDSIVLFSNASYHAVVRPRPGADGTEAAPTTAGAYVLGRLGMMWLADGEGAGEAGG
jgi:isopenicillin N synthase-like dioxygenase